MTTQDARGELTMLVTTVDSTTLATIAYDAAHQTLWLEFRSGAMYVYSSVPSDVHQALLLADSRGAYFNRHIRGRFRYFRQLNKLLTALPTYAD
jgi:KTSC domain